MKLRWKTTRIDDRATCILVDVDSGLSEVMQVTTRLAETYYGHDGKWHCTIRFPRMMKLVPYCTDRAAKRALRRYVNQLLAEDAARRLDESTGVRRPLILVNAGRMSGKYTVQSAAHQLGTTSMTLRRTGMR